MREIAADRTEYRGDLLRDDIVAAGPMSLFTTWLEAAYQSGTPEPTATQVATLDVGPDGVVQPHIRTVLLKTVDEEGFVFFTNYESAKSHQMTSHPQVALHWYWSGLSRAVRVNGQAERLGRAASQDYFASRPRDSQIGAWASPQSTPLASRDELLEAYERQAARFAEEEQVPRPPFWGGWRVRPQRVEFWQGEPSRLHERLVLSLVDGQWHTQRLAP